MVGGAGATWPCNSQLTACSRYVHNPRLFFFKVALTVKKSKYWSCCAFKILRRSRILWFQKHLMTFLGCSLLACTLLLCRKTQVRFVLICTFRSRIKLLRRYFWLMAQELFYEKTTGCLFAYISLTRMDKAYREIDSSYSSTQTCRHK